jgi:hypothetical protein
MEHDSPSPSAEAATPAVDDADTFSSTAITRRDGWTPFARRLFLEVLAETGRVSTACEYAGLTKQSAYALRARDPLFAAGWDAACEIARAPLADALYEKAVDGVTDIITKDGEVVAERHRFDSRLSIAVLHRLDKRCDRAEERGSRHTAAVRNWDQWLAHIGRGEDEAAATLLENAVLETARHGQLGQLSLGKNPILSNHEDPEEEDGMDCYRRCWKEDDVWLTDFPPPPGFDGYRIAEWGEHGYRRQCTDEEAELLEGMRAKDGAAERTEEEQLRDQWFGLLRDELMNANASDPADAPDAPDAADAADAADN